MAFEAAVGRLGLVQYGSSFYKKTLFWVKATPTPHHGANVMLYFLSDHFLLGAALEALISHFPDYYLISCRHHRTRLGGDRGKNDGKNRTC